jgi:hypothetical protein
VGKSKGGETKARGTRVRPVTQYEMFELDFSRFNARAAAEAAADVRDRLLAGAAIEPGVRSARVEVRPAKALTWAALAAAVGEAEAARIRGLVEPPDEVRLVVAEVMRTTTRLDGRMKAIRPEWEEVETEFADEFADE